MWAGSCRIFASLFPPQEAVPGALGKSCRRETQSQEQPCAMPQSSPVPQPTLRRHPPSSETRPLLWGLEALALSSIVLGCLLQFPNRHKEGINNKTSCPHYPVSTLIGGQSCAISDHHTPSLPPLTSHWLISKQIPLLCLSP
jgi:hypothetical protein